MAEVIYNDTIPFKGFQAITIWPFIFARNSAKWLKDYVINHESIHLRQQLEVFVVAACVIALLCLMFGISWWWMCVVPLSYYAWYGIEYAIRSIIYVSKKEGYRNICFEQEAYLNERDFNYLPDRKAFAWMKYLGRKTFRRL